MAWQFSHPDRSAGMIQAFRRPDCPYVSAQFKLHALESHAVYSVSDSDTGKTKPLDWKRTQERRTYDYHLRPAGCGTFHIRES